MLSRRRNVTDGFVRLMPYPMAESVSFNGFCKKFLSKYFITNSHLALNISIQRDKTFFDVKYKSTKSDHYNFLLHLFDWFLQPY